MGKLIRHSSPLSKHTWSRKRMILFLRIPYCWSQIQSISQRRDIRGARHCYCISKISHYKIICCSSVVNKDLSVSSIHLLMPSMPRPQHFYFLLFLYLAILSSRAVEAKRKPRKSLCPVRFWQWIGPLRAGTAERSWITFACGLGYTRCRQMDSWLFFSYGR